MFGFSFGIIAIFDLDEILSIENKVFAMSSEEIQSTRTNHLERRKRSVRKKGSIFVTARYDNNVQTFVLYNVFI